MKEKTEGQKLPLSEFMTNQDITLHIKNGQPSANVDGSIMLNIKKGKPIPEMFIPMFLKHNRNFIDNLTFRDGKLVLSKEVVNKYNITQNNVSPAHDKNIEPVEYTMEHLTVKLNELKDEKFKEWAEKKFGEDRIDRRKASKNIITDIIKIQIEDKQ